MVVNKNFLLSVENASGKICAKQVQRFDSPPELDIIDFEEEGDEGKEGLGNKKNGCGRGTYSALITFREWPSPLMPSAGIVLPTPSQGQTQVLWVQSFQEGAFHDPWEWAVLSCKWEVLPMGVGGATMQVGGATHGSGQCF